ncbi:ABC transporter permease [Ponticoccus sp. SC2-23]|uniref:ABC transporter permease n=1 Tax=Alexandriicola marinus TaxID=2081710 RepID=UPI000FD83A2A|nr:ABC transporter permease [Alexandriicola marinus]MBM1221296.1 ABC transporter permease [Ponticoccus sp. SC6-9]MBM1225866.1 ABC transporter permease [Ponticoccus sp. SC6-15]MBM1228018.1 ABC transporter permease [Ponticoccus sp. SC6-38]MBM1234344.1 ABC transporter permease [Ponticoccus sp. SC6-45]MBM1238520.1 ABC transporter permease [Ponticoccus sp. SC6-49]MBM1243789.1 ABC transporter permease [Ponticoccus sp. SC2-64]MBM1247868.1 ABC transporter permease [Ponticoccus sp. SC6-42]MBM1252920
MDVLIFIVGGTLAAATALIFAAMGELVAEKSGVLNLGIEGMMATGAAMAFVVLSLSGSYTLGFVAGAALGMVLSLVHAALTIIFRANQVASGLAVGILGLGLSSAIGKRYEGRTVAGLPENGIPFLSDIPVIGPMFFQQDIMVYLSILLIPATWYVLNRTKLGLTIRAIGESPEAAHALGLKVRLIRTGCVAFGGAMAGIGGAYMSTAYTPLWAEGMIAGRGWIVVALTVFGTWMVGRVAFGAYLFGSISLLELSIQAFGLNIPSQLMSALPYLVTIVMLAIISRNPTFIKLNSPASLGATLKLS